MNNSKNNTLHSPFLLKKGSGALLAALCFCVSTSLFAEEARVPIYQTPGEIEIMRPAGKLVVKAVEGGTYVEYDGNPEKEIIAKGVAFNVRVIPQAGGGHSLVYLDQYGEPFEDQAYWAALAAGESLPVLQSMFISNRCPDVPAAIRQMQVWQVRSLK